MTENSFIGPMSMVKIDGAKIKLLREQQGLTQLYLATAVEVTTDTISRWENRRYPSIKRDNGLKLAEALNVQLEDLLEEVPEEGPSPEASPQDLNHPMHPSEKKVSGVKKKSALLILSGTLFVALLAGIWFFSHTPSPDKLSVERIIPPHCISGQPFPVIIKVTGAPAATTALIIKESPPKGAIINATSPKVAPGGTKNNQIKWLKTIEGGALFAYVVSISDKEAKTVAFSGTAAISGEAESAISGKNTIIIGHNHWADTNNDNVISDEEVLAVYNLYGEITDIDLDIDLIEEIWLGSEYLWDSTTNSFKIID